jgi:predicted GTPase
MVFQVLKMAGKFSIQRCDIIIIQSVEEMQEKVEGLTTMVEKLQKELQEARDNEAARKKKKCNVVCK